MANMQKAAANGRSSALPFFQTGPGSPATVTGSATRPETAVTQSAFQAFADGFGGAIIGGLVYCMVLAYINPGELAPAWLRVVALSLACGGFEAWRAARKRTFRSVAVGLLCTLTASLFVLWALEGVVWAENRSPR